MSPGEDATAGRRLPLATLAVVSVLCFVGAGYAVNEPSASPVSFFTWVAVCVGAGLVVSVGILEEAFLSNVTSFAAAKWAVTGLVAVAVYWGRAAAIDDVNFIFHIDPSALPMTLAAGTVFHVAVLLRTAFVACGIAGLIALALVFKGRLPGGHATEAEKLRAFLIALSILLSGVLSAAFAWGQLSEAPRRQKLYLLAHMTDFSSSSRCEGIDSRANDVLFIGPEQRRVLVAPKVAPAHPLNEDQPALLRPVDIPRDFDVLECVPLRASSRRLPG